MNDRGHVGERRTAPGDRRVENPSTQPQRMRRTGNQRRSAEDRASEGTRLTMHQLMTDSPETTDLWYCWLCGEREHFVGHDGEGFLKQSVTVQVSEGAPDLDYGACHDVEIGQYDEIMCGSCGEQVWEDPRPPVPSTAVATVTAQILAFHVLCAENEYTDVGDVWEVFSDIYRQLCGRDLDPDSQTVVERRRLTGEDERS